MEHKKLVLICSLLTLGAHAVHCMDTTEQMAIQFHETLEHRLEKITPVFPNIPTEQKIMQLYTEQPIENAVPEIITSQPLSTTQPKPVMQKKPKNARSTPCTKCCTHCGLCWNDFLHDRSHIFITKVAQGCLFAFFICFTCVKESCCSNHTPH